MLGLEALNADELQQLAAVASRPSDIVYDPFKWDWSAYTVGKSPLPNGWTFAKTGKLLAWDLFTPLFRPPQMLGFDLLGSEAGARRNVYWVPAGMKAPIGLIRADLVAAVRAAAQAKVWAPELLQPRVNLTPGEAFLLWQNPGQGWLHKQGRFWIFPRASQQWERVKEPKSKNVLKQLEQFGENAVDAFGEALQNPGFLATVGLGIGAGIGAAAAASAASAPGAAGAAGAAVSGSAPIAVTAPGASLAAGATPGAVAAGSTAAGQVAAAAPSWLSGAVSIPGGFGTVGAGLSSVLDLTDQALDVADTVGGIRAQVDGLLAEFAPDEGLQTLNPSAPNAPLAARTLDNDAKVWVMLGVFVALAVLFSGTRDGGKES